MAIMFGMLCISACGRGLLSTSEGRGFAIGSLIYGGLIGAGADALHTGRTTIYGPGAPRSAGATRPSRVIAFKVRF